MIAIVGAGQLGSRHLQSLALLDRPVSVQVVDPRPDSLEAARRRLAEVPEAARLKDVRYLAGLSELAPRLDLAVVATLSDVRERVVTELLESRRVGHLILEKVLFQDPGAYARVGALLRERGVKAWVNCPRRLWPHVARLRERLAGSRWLEVSVSGTQWGLASNAVHFLDLMAFLAGRSDFRLSTELLDPGVLESKRSGFIELSGTLSASLSGFGLLTMTCRPGDALDYEIVVRSDRFKAVIRELEDRSWVAGAAGGWAWREEAFPRPLMSRHAYVAVEALLGSGSCGLTPFDESAALHLPLLEALLGHLRRAGRGGGLCPIT